MATTVNLVCANHAHAKKAPIVAQFRHDDKGGWGRIGGKGQHDLLWEDGDIRVKHHAKCPRCERGYEFREERLYPLLDWAMANGKDIPVR